MPLSGNMMVMLDRIVRISSLSTYVGELIWVGAERVEIANTRDGSVME